MATPEGDRRWLRWLDGGRVDARLAGGKAATIARLQGAGLPVAPGFCLTTEAARHFLACNGAADRLDRLVKDIDVSGHELSRLSLALTEIYRDGVFPGDLAGAVEQAAGELTGHRTARRLVVVRSSGTAEDGATASAAGVHLSRTGVAPDGILEAVRDVWASLYGLPALYYRRRSGVPTAGAEMGVLVQLQLRPAALGVLFTRDPGGGDGGLLEWCDGDPAAESVMDGAAPRGRIRLTAGLGAQIGDAEFPGWLEHLIPLGHRVEELLGGAADIEWAHTGEELFLLQARPITTLPNRVAGAPFQIVPADRYASGDFDLRGCAGLHAQWRRKHAAMRNLAQRAGVDVAACFLVSYTTPVVPEVVAGLMPSLRTPYVFLDVSDELRSIVVPVEELSKHLRLLCGSEDASVVRVRECYTEHASLLSGVVADGSVLIEHTPGGIKGLIRGLSSANQYLVDARGQVELAREVRGRDEFLFDARTRAFVRAVATDSTVDDPAPGIGAEMLRTVAAFTRRATSPGRLVHLEWSVSRGVPHLLDHSVEESATPPAVHGGREIMSAGSARGTAFVIGDIRPLEYVSDGNLVSVGSVAPAVHEDDAVRDLMTSLRARAGQGPIIVVAARPVTALALVVSEVDGFVFEDGALLSHLAILIREAGKPAVLVRDATTLIPDGAHVALEPDGSVEVAVPDKDGGTPDAHP
jgi:phosphohistidine swiveling domain-containing protein